ncbi:MAG: DUF4241 domain-containing protein [Gemmatimonadales bacterium]|nr:DUF4241 domain-containing protein [Gemmatimonadales bacterium]
MSVPFWAAALEPGPHTTSHAGPLVIEHREIGRVRLPSGRIVASDPFFDPDVTPFARAVSPGEYPVRLAIARLADGDQRNAAAWVVFKDAPVAAWRGATVTGSGTTTDLGKAIAYFVESGTGSFLSPEAAAVLDARLDDKTADEIRDQMQANATAAGDWAVVEWAEHPMLNVVLFSTAYGDGAYGCYWGDDSAGSPVLLLTDFGLLDPPSADTGAGEPRRWWKFW